MADRDRTARYFDGIPHIVIFGAYDDKNEKCWILLWRQGKAFRITVDAEDVKDTAFYRQWRPLIKEDAPNRFDQFEQLCDLIIITSMDLLQELAPVQPHWQTIAEYLHTPRYLVKFAPDDIDETVRAQVVEGPEDVPPYTLKPAQVDDLSSFAGSIHQYHSHEAAVLDASNNWRIRPSKVRTSDGQNHYFLACEWDTRAMPENLITNRAWEQITTFIRLHKSLEQMPDSWPNDVPKVTGIVHDNGLLAGILLQYREQNPLGKISHYQKQNA